MLTLEIVRVILLFLKIESRQKLEFLIIMTFMFFELIKKRYIFEYIALKTDYFNKVKVINLKSCLTLELR